MTTEAEYRKRAQEICEAAQYNKKNFDEWVVVHVALHLAAEDRVRELETAINLCINYEGFDRAEVVLHTLQSAIRKSRIS